MSDTSIKSSRIQLQVIKAFEKSQSVSSLERIHWNNDISKSSIALKALRSWLDNLSNLVEVSMLGCITSKTTRDQMRQTFYTDNYKKVILTT